ncbi:MAG TPA: MBL fold metallo-hydrolase [Gemmatimonadaceae bacterium]|nr:MBL fold metallo-hydrolase [Gemmatimonadaceae bacterium]
MRFAIRATRFAFGVALALTTPLGAQLTVRELAPRVFLVPGDTGRGSEGRANAGFVVTDSGVVVIDALGSPRQGEALLRAVRSVTKQPVRWLILTHHHPDHHFGAAALRAAGARVVAHPDRSTLASDAGDSALAAAYTAALGAEEMRGFAFADVPDVPVRGDTTLRVGGRTIDIVQPGAAHTPGDLMVWLPDERVLFAGDVLIEDGVTMVVDGSSGAVLRALDRIDSLAPRVLVPGHGRTAHDPAAALALTARTRCYVDRARADARAAVADGTPLGRFLRRLPPEDAGRPVSRASLVRRNAVRVYLEMERESPTAGSSSAAGTAVVSCR